ncbi:hypothetical protein RRG08_054260 [Elysia crispata]|uniref:DUF19 domain-containing protein n=1 Tax=Elysia crispata TaxID=231223 RepID=A0AAE0YC48_9GAST|nr:hypothetical protein RRG08_054260 [Elysia crispata]
MRSLLRERMEVIALAWTFFFLMAAISDALAACDHKQAENCVINMEAVITSAVEETTGVARSERLQSLCLDVIKGNNLTQCFINATSSCTGADSVAPTQIIQRWERIMQDLYSLCDGACPGFLEKTVNITQCTGLVRFDALYDSSYNVFCSSLNRSLECVRDTSDQCPQFSRLFYDLLPEGMDTTATTICTGGCDNLDSAMTNLESCKTYVTSMPDDLEKACVSYQKFKSCVEMSEAPVSCPMFSSLMEVLYPQHIFGLYEQNCNTTQLTGKKADQCGSLGIARIDHCIRIFALAWPSDYKEEKFSERQCTDFMTGMRCLEHSGFSRCSSIRRHFLSATRRRKNQMSMMKKLCPRMVQSIGSVPGWTPLFFLPALLLSMLGLSGPLTKHETI